MLTAAVPVLLVLSYGGCHPALWAGVMALFFVAWGILHAAGRVSFPSGSATGLILMSAAAVPVIQSLPLPGDLLRIVSAQRARWVQETVETAHVSPLWASLSYAPTETLFRAALWLGYALFACWLHHGFRRSRAHRTWFVRVLFLLAATEAAYGLFQVLFHSAGVLWEGAWAYAGHARGTFINRNHYAAFLGMVWPLLAAWAAAPRRGADSWTHLTPRVFCARQGA